MPTVIKICSLWACKNASNKKMILVSPEEEKIVTFTYSLVIEQRADLKTGVLRKQITPNVVKNEHFLPPDT